MTSELGPLLCYVPFRYFVLVPRTLWSVLTRGERQVILRHELAHLVRRDLWWALAIRVLALPQWFNPLVWRAVRGFDEAGEWACDDWVSRGRRHRQLAFARSLLATAEYATTSSPGTASLQGGELARRVKRLVSQRFKEEAMVKKLLVLAPMCAIALVQGIRIEQVTADEPAAPSTIVNTKARGAPPRGILPPYVIEPPDVLLINAVKLVPKPPHKIEAFDGLLVRVLGTLADRPIADAFAVDSDGKIDLGPPYGRVEVAGMTVDDAQSAIERRLAMLLEKPDVSVSLAFSGGAQKITGKHLVGPDGRVNLGIYGTVYVSGMTVEEARRAIEEKLSEYLHDPQVVVYVANYSSKKYYVIMRSPGRGDHVQQVPISGNETVLDAIAAIGGVPQNSAKKIWISRPSAHGDGPDTILPVRWDDIANGKSVSTNYQLLPGDRLFVLNAAETTDADSKLVPESVAPNPKSNYYNAVRDPLNAAAESKSKSVKSVQYDIDMIEDRTGALAEYASGIDAAIVDSKTIGPALRVMSKHNLIRKTSSPPLSSHLGERTMVGFDATGVSLILSTRESDRGLLVELFLKAKHGVAAKGIDSAASLKPGQMWLLPIPVGHLNAETVKEGHPLYLTITPSLLSNVHLAEPPATE